jgi:transposase
MIKRTLFLAILALAIAVPVAAADSGNPPVSSAAAPAAKSGRADRTADRMQQLRERIRHVTGVFVKRCGKNAHPANADKCKAAAQKLLAKLQSLDAKIQAKIQAIQAKCADASTAPKACAHADQLVQRLQDLDSKIQQLEQKVQAWLSGGASGDSSSLEGLGQLADDLASLQSQNP